MAENPKICPQLHLPLQSASNPVLLKMKRRYTIEYYDQLLSAFRKAVPDLAISTDIIVGFPGETEADFQATYDYLAQTRYDSAFLFKYSPRPGTKAYQWENPTCGEPCRTVPEEEKLRRLAIPGEGESKETPSLRRQGQPSPQGLLRIVQPRQGLGQDRIRQELRPLQEAGIASLAAEGVEGVEGDQELRRLVDSGQKG